MSATVRISDIVQALELQLKESSSWVNLETGEVETVSDDLLRHAEECEEGEEPNLPEWQKREWQFAKQIVRTNGFVRLPTKNDIHEWAIMQEFSLSVESSQIREELLYAIHGRGAFRMFKDVLSRHRIQENWFAFRADALQAIARCWCEEHHIPWT
jgi:hypothetical protein